MFITIYLNGVHYVLCSAMCDGDLSHLNSVLDKEALDIEALASL
jgi:hypothetical protein